MTYKPGDLVRYTAAPVFDGVIDTGDIGVVTRVVDGWVHAVWPSGVKGSVPTSNV
ncbi:hypothetical protein [Aeromicrobium sp. Leaf350]|uniref:hypothetical protein n=1 Tax=Aeromicrobium sp. Leaf350 TaxID=2876565 RepID=UPI001E5EECC0|nr:hypothetical protein [Aeromicrobium sp. Leaf350]